MMPPIHRRAVCEICGEEILTEKCYVFEDGACFCDDCVDRELIDKIDPRLMWQLMDWAVEHHKETPDWWEEEEGMP